MTIMTQMTIFLTPALSPKYRHNRHYRHNAAAYGKHPPGTVDRLHPAGVVEPVLLTEMLCALYPKKGDSFA